ncbi:RluA family pseudouridine synthase [Acetilactobacillus jinshanensis]|uniref:RluA family pseudouridine synthase n=1 Tax=Acetilactobacillus jinshanensis TaxID=1720083 RepID=UPI0013A6338B|nr:RluA family pseudouridine synthase [Acetilactobacillus jinshanensis]URL60752.1 RluA family pseudouridine synthase [uncultured bacterium]
MKKVKFHGGRILVNNHARRTNYNLQPNDLVTMILPPEPSNPNVVPSDKPIKIIYESHNFLVVHKPGGIASIPNSRYKQDTLTNRVKGYFIRKKYSNLRIHIVNRLDRNTSGMVIFAKNHFAHSVLDYQLKNNQIIKKYITVIKGRLNPKTGLIILPIGQDSNSLVKQRVSVNGKYSKTGFRVIDETNHYTLVSVRLYTGRTHQIRVHFSTIGHPIIGDWLYGKPIPSKRLALHCYYLSFYDVFRQKRLKLFDPVPFWIQHFYDIEHK